MLDNKEEFRWTHKFW